MNTSKFELFYSKHIWQPYYCIGYQHTLNAMLFMYVSQGSLKPSNLIWNLTVYTLNDL